ncbi:Zn-dependent hydrolase [Salinirussus salinus]|uniref:Zn-dependent hydrolase n=1 Tax=Salinirussus salinus TaxID=1198300 RepID=UPI00135B0C42|nr:Zn-dependent hydrolase [Salinirussus salinus]
MDFAIDRERLVDTMREQAEIGATDGGGLHRLALSEDDRRARDWFVEQLEELGLDVRVDEFGNTFGYREGSDPDAGTVLLGSHLDSQPYGGIYDGALGVVAALEFVRELEDRGVETAHPVEVVNWTNEEGSRFQPAMQGSGVWVSDHDIEEEYAKTDSEGAVLEEELERVGYRGEVPAEPQREYEAYLELHIEQGPYLESAGADVGVVTGIVGFSWGAVTFEGEADHAGPTPMHTRSDALVAASDFVTGVRRVPGALGERTVATVGSVDLAPDSINVIPEEVTVTWDLRDPDDATIDEGRQRVLAEADAAAAREGVDWSFEDRMRASPVEFADGCVDAVQNAADAGGYDSLRMVSGAGHDATHMTAVMDTGMVFAVSEDGTSHNEDEYTSRDDCYSAADTYAKAAYRLASDEGA